MYGEKEGPYVKKLWLVLLGLLLVMAVAPTAMAEKVTIEYWQYYFESKVKLVDRLIKEFEAENPDIKVVHTTFPYERFNERVAAAVPAGTGPDLVNLYYGWLPKYIESGYLQPLPKEFGALIDKSFLPMVAGGVKFKGEYWALPTAVRSLALFYNKDLFAQAGIKAPPKTWDELLEIAKKLTVRTNRGQLLQAGYAWNVDGQDHHIFREVLLRQYGITPYSVDNRKVQYNSKPEGYQAFQWWLDMTKKHGVGEASFLGNYRTAFIAGKAAMMVDGSFAIGALKSNVKNFKWGVAELPVLVSGGTKSNFGSYWAHGLTSKAQGAKREAALKFLDFITSEPVQRIWLEEVGELPARTALTQDPKLVSDPVFGPFISGLRYAHATFFADEDAERKAIMDATDMVILKNTPVKQALDWLSAEVQKILDGYWSRQK